MKSNLLGPYELLHRIAERRGAKVLLLIGERDGRTTGLTHLMVFDRANNDAALAVAQIPGKTLDEAALSCLRQLKVRV